MWGSKCCHHALGWFLLAFHTFLFPQLKPLPARLSLNYNWFQFLFPDAFHGLQNMSSTMLSLKWSASVLSLLIGFVALYVKVSPVFVTKALYYFVVCHVKSFFPDISICSF